MTPRLNKELSQKLHDAGIRVGDSLYVEVGRRSLPTESLRERAIRDGWKDEILFARPILQELLMTKEAEKLLLAVAVCLNRIYVDGFPFPDWQSATDYVGELLLKIRRR